MGLVSLGFTCVMLVNYGLGQFSAIMYLKIGLNERELSHCANSVDSTKTIYI